MSAIPRYQPAGDALPRRRRSDRLLTLDRALLLGIFAVGGWVATADLRHGNLTERVKVLEVAEVASTQKAAEHDTELAVIEAELRHLNENLQKLAESTARLANAAQEPR